jgi:hypothetical protein
MFDLALFSIEFMRGTDARLAKEADVRVLYMNR